MAARPQMFPRAGYWFLGLLGLAFLAFWPPYFSRLPFGPEAFVHLHLAGVLLWMALLIAQPFLIARGQWPLHRRIGKASYFLVPYVVATSLVLAHSRGSAAVAAGTPMALVALYLPIVGVLLFVTCYGLAMWNRRKPFLHARYMIGTALPLVDPITARLIAFYSPVQPPLPVFPLIGFGLTDLLLLWLIWADRKQARGREAFRILLPIFLVAHAGLFTLAMSAPWAAFARAFLSLPLG